MPRTPAEPLYHFSPGSAPLLVDVPHAGTHLPSAIADTMTDAARATPNTDWHVDRLYGFARDLGASMLVATHSRYVVDLNRPPDGASLYPGARNTELCPLTTFDDEPIYRPGTEPGSDEIARRRAAYWDPYHQRLASEIAGLRERHGFVLVWDAHSIRSRVPRFFEGRLAELNLGTARGTSADPALGPRLLALAEQTPGYSAVLDGRFTGGYITRHYGTPATNAHVVQLELTQECYMDESPPYLYRGDLASRIQPVIRALIECALDHLHTVRRPH